MPLCGIAAAVAGAICSHHYGVIYVGAPLFAGQAVRLARTRRIDFPIVVAVGCSVLTLLFTFPLVRESRPILTISIPQSTTLLSKPTPHQTPYLTTTSPLALLVAYALVFYSVMWTVS